MKTIVTTIITAALIVSSFVAQAQGTFKVDNESSNVAWVGKKVTGEHNGTINVKSGTVTKNGDKISGSFVIDMTTIVVADIENPDYNAKLKGHLESGDFFAVEEFTEATFKITSAKPSDSKEGNYQITGDLTIKGITNSITFVAQVDEEGDTLTATGDIKIDRTKWNIRYGSGSFFEGLGDKMIYDEIELTLKLNATK